MKSFKIALLAMVAFLVSCQKSDLYADLVEGPATIKLFLNDGSMTTKGTGLNGSEEKVISSVQILIFDGAGKIVTNQYFPTYNSNTGIQNIATRSGSNMSIYAIANFNAQNGNFAPIFDNVKTIADLNAVKVYNLLNDVTQNRTLMMWGLKTGVNIPALPTVSSVSFTMSYVASKVRVFIVDDTPIDEDISMVDWQIVNASKFSYIVAQASDAVNPSLSTDYITSSSFAWNDTIVGGKAAKYTVFYLFENRRGGRQANSNTPVAPYVPGAISGTDPKDKVWYAPPTATAIVANGFYHTAIKHTGIVAKIYLGANNYNDYNVARGNDYTYTVTVKGVNDIDIDSRIDGNNRGFQADILSTTLDCHYDWRPIRLQAFGGTLKIELLNGDGITAPSWLKLSAINLNQFIYNGATYTRPTYNPLTDMKSVINNIAFVDGSTISTQMYYLYADEYNVQGGVRTANVKITSSDVGSTPITIPITQKGYQTMGDVGLRKFTLLGAVLPTSAYKIIVENQEEAAMNLTSGAATGVEKTTTMQWGFYNVDMQPVTVGSIVSDSYIRNGYDNSANLVMSNTTLGTLRAPYGRVSSSTISEQVHNPIFNSYATRYCFEKNRDVDGDGVIKGSEVQWYLPSLDELMLIYVGEPSLSQNSTEKLALAPYQSSTEFSTTTDNMGAHFANGRSGTVAKNTPINVRCIRAIN